MSLRESIVGNAALEWFGEFGYAVGHGPQLAPSEPAAERNSFAEAVLIGRLREALRRLNPAIFPCTPAMKTISGDLIQLAKNGQFDHIAHGCNCFCTMGARIAKAVKEIFPAAVEADQATQQGDRAKLGTCSFAEIALETSSLIVVYAYTQFAWRGRGPKVDYAAVRSCMGWIKKRHPERRIGLPKIGAGLAGGDWPTISTILEEELAGEDLTLVEYRP